mmetsp:Transcript_74829/g.216287  ORF Transcript_74829/g.216287 Transcript_74829/m.216287 type:complete len:279 (+) Transcript_74829:252-1088(+)
MWPNYRRCCGSMAAEQPERRNQAEHGEHATHDHLCHGHDQGEPHEWHRGLGSLQDGRCGGRCHVESVVVLLQKRLLELSAAAKPCQLRTDRAEEQQGREDKGNRATHQRAGHCIDEAEVGGQRSTDRGQQHERHRGHHVPSRRRSAVACSCAHGRSGSYVRAVAEGGGDVAAQSADLGLPLLGAGAEEAVQRRAPPGARSVGPHRVDRLRRCAEQVHTRLSGGVEHDRVGKRDGKAHAQPSDQDACLRVEIPQDVALNLGLEAPESREREGGVDDECR